MSDKLIYLASPYSHKDEHVRMIRALLVTAVGSMLIEEGIHVYGPITESYSYANINPKIDGKWEFWEEHDLLMIDKCDEVWVLQLKGWRESVGVNAEINYAKLHKKPLRFLELSEYIDLGEII